MPDLFFFIFSFLSLLDWVCLTLTKQCSYPDITKQEFRKNLYKCFFYHIQILIRYVNLPSLFVSLIGTREMYDTATVLLFNSGLES